METVFYFTVSYRGSISLAATSLQGSCVCVHLYRHLRREPRVRMRLALDMLDMAVEMYIINIVAV